ncbi:MAG TPA: hypothetical protein VIL74_14110 [Pyrinomonadaceae bacterium]|jgi:hypothetical protein
MKSFLVAVGAALCGLSALFSGGGTVRHGGQNLEADIATAICAIENGNYGAARAVLAEVLKKEPKNIYAQRLLPGVAAREIKRGDQTPENIALVRKAIAAYETALLNPDFRNESADINRFIIELYAQLGGEEKRAGLLKKAENEADTPPQRAAFYTALAADDYACANEISDAAPVKSTVKRGGKDVYVFRKPKNPATFERLRKCAAGGFDLSGKALALDPESDTAWSYRASLLAQLARIAEMENKPAEKARLMQEYDAARDKFLAASRRRTDEQARLSEERFSESASADLNFSPADVSAAELKEISQELKAYRAARPLAETVDRVDIPFALFDPFPFEDASPAEPSRTQAEPPRRGWQTFSPEGGFSALLPADAAVSSTADSRIYTASGDGLAFFILETTRSVELSENEQDAALNISAWILTKYVGNSLIGGSGRNARFESDLTRKDKFADRPARFYAYRMISCRETREGTMLFVLGKRKNYAIDIRGASETDERVRKFLNSLKLD